MIYFLIHDAIHWLCVSVRVLFYFCIVFLSFIPAQTISLRAIAKHSAGHVTEDIKRTKPERPVLYIRFLLFILNLYCFSFVSILFASSLSFLHLLQLSIKTTHNSPPTQFIYLLFLHLSYGLL